MSLIAFACGSNFCASAACILSIKSTKYITFNVITTGLPVDLKATSKKTRIESIK